MSIFVAIIVSLVILNIILAFSLIFIERKDPTTIEFEILHPMFKK